jgi:transcriptional regulator with PAS, ATPase and Fis domain
MVFDAVVRSEPGNLSISSILEQTGIDSAQQSGDAPETSIGAEAIFRSLSTLPTLRAAAALLIDEALKRSGNNQAAAAKLLGISRAAMNKRLNRPRTEKA